MKHGKLVVLMPQLTEAQRAAIVSRAASYGLETVISDHLATVMPFAPETEIFFGSTPDFTKAAPRLRWVCSAFAGVNQFLAPGALPGKDVMLTNSSGAYGVTISEHIIMVTLEIMRRQPDYNTIVGQKQWIRNLPIRSVKGCRITLLGTGDIGQETAVRLRSFSPTCLLGVNRSGRNPGGLFDSVVPREKIDSVLPGTDLLIVSLPGTEETFQMLDKRRLSLLPDGAIVVNVGRGSVIEQKALTGELLAGRLRAALDVFEEEPIPADDPIWTCPNLLITPHVAGNTTLPYTVERIVQLFLENLDRYMKSLPLLRLVDPSKGY